MKKLPLRFEDHLLRRKADNETLRYIFSLSVGLPDRLVIHIPIQGEARVIYEQAVSDCMPFSGSL